MKVSKTFYSRLHYNAMLLRVALVGLLLLSGNMKWFSPEMMLVDHLTQNTWLSFLPAYLGGMGTSYFLAVFQAAMVLGLVVGVVFPVTGALAALGIVVSSVITVSVLPALMDGSLHGHLLKEVAMMIGGVFLLHHDAITAMRRNSRKIVWDTQNKRSQITFPH